MSLTPDDLRQIRSLIVEGTLEAIEIAVNPRLDAIEADVAVLKSDVAELKSDVAELKSDVSGLKDDMRSVKSQLSELNQRVSNLERLSGDTSDRLEIIENDIRALYELVDKKPVSKFANNKQYLALSFDKKLIELDKEVHHLADTNNVKLPI